MSILAAMIVKLFNFECSVRFSAAFAPVPHKIAKVKKRVLF